jgi:large subunit ribosomal protein L10
MPKTREQKFAVVDKLAKAFKSAKSVAFANYQGLTVAQADTLRKNAREANVDYMVAKKTLMTRAAKDAGYDVDAKQFQGMIGAAFAAQDEVAPAKVLGDMTKGTPMQLVGGIFDGAAVSKEKIVELSKLPSKKELLGMLVGTLNGIPAAFVRLTPLPNSAPQGRLRLRHPWPKRLPQKPRPKNHPQPPNHSLRILIILCQTNRRPFRSPPSSRISLPRLKNFPYWT